MTILHDGNLLPCPFCGEEAVIGYYKADERLNKKEAFYVGCGNEQCGCEIEHTGGFKTLEEAIQVWNRRSDDKLKKIEQIITADYLWEHSIDHKYRDIVKVVKGYDE